jgi:hypothetical protein
MLYPRLPAQRASAFIRVENALVAPRITVRVRFPA